MGCHKHEVLDGFYFSSGSTPDDQAKIEIMYRKHIDSSICFYGGECEDLRSMKAINDLVKLPFDDCWIEFDVFRPDGLKQIFAHLTWNEDDFIAGLLFVKFGGTWKCVCSYELFSDETANINHREPGTPKQLILQHIACLRIFLSALNCVNVQRIEQVPDIKLQKARQRRGKLPLYSYWTLHVDLDRDPTKSQSTGGVHASPRLHLRRGHARQFAPGKYCWVRACAVGTGKNGMVHKDYTVKQHS